LTRLWRMFAFVANYQRGKLYVDIVFFIYLVEKIFSY
jgi:hypothetical protein